MKKSLIIIVILALIFSLVACNNTTTTPQPEEPKKLATPSGLAISIDGLISWNEVENATGYILTINGENYNVQTTSYQADKSLDMTVSVVAVATGYENSDSSKEKEYKSPFTPQPPIVIEDVVLGIEGSSQMNSGGTLKLTANVTGTENKAVNWKIEKGGEFATISEDGVITAIEVDGDKTIKVVCTSAADKKVSATKIINIRARTVLTQDMIDALASKNKISFVGFITINLYTIGINPKPYMTYSTAVKTAMDGTNWYAEYENEGIKQGIYYKNYNGYANQVGLSLMNDELYEPMLGDDGEKVKWEDSGMFNNFAGLKVSDFKFNEKEWRWVYCGADKNLPSKMLASANPYEFTPKGFSLIIEDDEIMGIYSMSEDDYTLATNYKAIQELFVAIDSGDTVDVKTISKYSTDEIHADLTAALNNMHALNSYKVKFKSIISSVYASGYTMSGFDEFVTANDCYFMPFDISTDNRGTEIYKYKENGCYGYHKIDDNLYNAFIQNVETGKFNASRAYQKDFANAKPTFAFAAEIFRFYEENVDEGTMTYYVDDLMSNVATTYYYGLGNDIQLYGIFATRAYVSTDSSFTPYVTVKDGYIVEAGFYFYLGSMYGVVELEYSEFNKVEIPEDVNIEFETRQVPTSWGELTIQIADDDTQPEEYEVNALDFLKEFYQDEDIDNNLPFFGDVLGDTYGFGMTTYHIASDRRTYRAVCLYYDVPLDLDYTINSSLGAIEDMLTSLGFVKNKENEFEKDGIVILPYDSSLDLLVYIWKK